MTEKASASSLVRLNLSDFPLQCNCPGCLVKACWVIPLEQQDAVGNSTLLLHLRQFFVCLFLTSARQEPQNLAKTLKEKYIS